MKYASSPNITFSLFSGIRKNPIWGSFSMTLVFSLVFILVSGCASSEGSGVCAPDCSNHSCGELDPLCSSACGTICDFGCTDHCSNGEVDCDELSVDCGGSDCMGCSCVPDCTDYSCGDIEPICMTECGASCDTGCTDHCYNDTLDCDETDVDCGGTSCMDCGCVPNCAGYSCGIIEPTCSTECGDMCDPGCTSHCSNGVQDCDETDVDCGGSTCSSCACVPDCTGLSCGQLETTCGTACGTSCDAGCTAHCSNGGQDCDETGVDCGGISCSSCVCIPNCTGYTCGATEPTCSTTCGTICDLGCTAHCSNGVQDCDETGVDCGGSSCSACPCVPNCAGYSCGTIEPTCSTTCGSACDAGCTAHCSNGVQDCDETGTDCGGISCSACSVGGCGDTCYSWSGTCSSTYINACDGCDMGCEVHDPDCDDPASTCLSNCSCLLGYSNWYCDGWDDCSDTNCECSGE
jgi:hypothetical protein